MTHAGRALGFMTDPQWVEHQIRGLPARWQDTIRTEWGGSWSELEDQRRAANMGVLHTVAQLQDAQRAGLRLDATEDDIRGRAVVFARHYARIAEHGDIEFATSKALAEMQRHGMADYFPGWKPGQPGKWCPKRGKNLRSILARVACESFWRRVLRKVFAQTIERCSIGLGLVNKRRDCYVSDLSVKRRRAQVAANAAMMEATELENERGERFKLADLAAKSTACKTVRRAELMTRISGFEKVADEVGHGATFVTVTCPSRMHKWTDRDGGVFPNRRYDGTTPREAQAYLSKQWAKMRAAMARQGVEVYGFRVAEPHHDGCPHWHMLLWHKVSQGAEMRALFVRYFLLNDSATERGADDYRLKFQAIDRTEGSAAAYIAKYISKSIDGYKVGVDMWGNDAIESSARVEAWASTWRIRQFQQIGGAPVTVWRELRRINTEGMPADLLPDSLAAGLGAVNIGQTGALWAHGWANYIKAQGGPCAGRKAQRIKLLRQDTGEVNRYHEVKAADVIGVEAFGVNHYLPKHCAHLPGADKGYHRITRPAAARVESERSLWRVVVAGRAFEPISVAERPWTRVNNCTRDTIRDRETGAVRAYAIVQRSKVGRVKRWQGSNGKAGGPSGGVEHGSAVATA